MADFYQLAGFPWLVRAIDGLLIPIGPPYNDEHLYPCHNGSYAVILMGVCNANLPFTNFIRQWHGSVHDSAILNGSTLHAHLENGGETADWLLGDRDYAIQPTSDDSNPTQRGFHFRSKEISNISHKNKKPHRKGLWLVDLQCYTAWVLQTVPHCLGT